MLNFIICDDESNFRNIINKEIENFMMNYDTDYKIYQFTNYDSKFEKLAQEDIGFKVYFLDIKTNVSSGLDAARYIREELDDWNSLIIIVTAFTEYRYEALSNRLYLLDFISKFNDFSIQIKSVLKIAYKNYNDREKCLSYEYNYTIYKIDFKHIIYIEKEQDSKRCIIYTTHGIFKAPFSLSSISKLLDDRFVKVHKSIIVNIDKIETYDVKQNEILFTNGMSTNFISRSGKKVLLNHVIANQ